MDYVADIGCPDILLSRGEGEEWILCPVSADARAWADEQSLGTGGRNVTIRGFTYVCELFDSLTDRGLTVR